MKTFYLLNILLLFLINSWILLINLLIFLFLFYISEMFKNDTQVNNEKKEKMGE